MTFHVNTHSARWSHWRDISSPRWLLGRTTPQLSTVSIMESQILIFALIFNSYNILPEEVIFFENMIKFSWLWSRDLWLPAIQNTFLFSVYGHLFTFGSNKYGQLGVGDFRRRKGICRVGGGLTGKVVDTVTCGDGFTVASINGRFSLGDHCHLREFWSTHVHQHCTLHFEYFCSYFNDKIIICHLFVSKNCLVHYF